MKFLDLFAGIGGFHLGMEQADHQCVGYVEWDKFARQSYQAIFNTKGLYNGKDIKSVKGSELPKADVWCFGSPCQNISVAGNQKGLKGEQSSMFFEVIRLLNETDGEKKPSYLLMENVKNLLSSQKGWDFTELLHQMDEVGYDVEWSVINSSDVVPQNRERIFIVGHLRGQHTRKVFPIVRQNGKTTLSIKEVAKIYPNRHSSDANSVLDPSGIAHTVTAHSAKTQPKIVIPVLTPDRAKKRQNGRRFKTNGEPEFTLTGQDRHGVLTNDARIRKLTPRECWRLQGFPDWAFDKAKASGVSNSQLYKQAGNAVTVPVIKAIAERFK